MMVSLENVSKGFRSEGHTTPVLEGVNLSILDGEFVAILGSSGSGKTTLLNLIGGLDRDFTGRAVVAGLELKTLSDGRLSAFRNRTVGFVFQSFNLLPHLTVEENVRHPAYFNPEVGRRQARELAQEAMAATGIAHKARAMPNTLSGGERQRCAIARALFMKPRLLLADEPTGNLDSASGGAILELFGELNRNQGMTLLLVTHDLAAAALARRTIQVRDGRIIAGGS
jgi:putative ABC transport system ATP-binding protein